MGENGNPPCLTAFMEAHGEGALLFIGSQLKPDSSATLDQYHRYYDEELVPTVLNFPFPNGPKTILRYKNETASPSIRSMAFVGLFPLRELRLLHGPIRARAIAMARERPLKAFDGDNAYQHVDFDDSSFRYLYKLDEDGEDKVIDSDQEQLKGSYPLTMIADSFDAPQDLSSKLREEALFKSTYQLPWRFQICEHYLQSLVYKLLAGKTPRYLILHFFAVEPVKLGKDVLDADAQDCLDRQVYSLLRSRGDMIYPPPADTTTPNTASFPTPERAEPSSRRCNEDQSAPKKSPSPKPTTSWATI